jgi:putative protein kinase ArgK-like GTPase of G3E family
VENTERALRGSLNLAHPLPHRFMHPGKDGESSGHGEIKIIPAQSAAPDAAEPMWVPPILRTVALDGTGISRLAEAIADHRTYLDTTGGWKQRERWRLQTELDLLLQNTLVEGFRSRLPAGAYEQALQDMVERRISPFEAVEKLFDGSGGFIKEGK